MGKFISRVSPDFLHLEEPRWAAEVGQSWEVGPLPDILIKYDDGFLEVLLRKLTRQILS